MRTSRWPAPPVPGGFGLPLGFAAGIAATFASIAAGATGHPVRSVIALTIVVAGVAAVTTPAAAVGAALLCWCLHDGFVVGRHGELQFTSGAGIVAVVLVATVTVVVPAALAMRILGQTGAASAQIPRQRRPQDRVDGLALRDR